jgi:sarcosine oxidase subunit gamma
MFESRSALERYRSMQPAAAVDGSPALKVGEVRGTQLIQLGVYPGGAEEVLAAVLPILGELPNSSSKATTFADALILRISPDQYWISGGPSDFEARLRHAIPPTAGCVTSLEGGRTRLFIEGHAARAVLRRLVAVDLDPPLFPVQGFAQTGIHHVGGLLLRAGQDRYEFFALRTFAASTFEVLLDAARPFGFEIVLPESKK